MRYRGALGWLIGLTTMLAAPGAALAATVTTTADSGGGSLRAAIAASASGDTINFAPALDGQTITLAGALVIPHALTISGPGASSLTINGNHAGTVFDIEASGATDTVTISGLTITNGKFTGTGGTGGGGIFANRVATLDLSGDVITGNQASINPAASAGGGGVYVNGGIVNVSNSTISNNTATITGATSSGQGGGGLYSQGGKTNISGSDISHNTVTQSLTSNSGSDGGGGIYSDGGDLAITNSTVNANTDTVDSSQSGSDGGGGIYNAGGTIDLAGVAVNGNTFTLSSATSSDSGGGGVYSEGGDVDVVSSSIDANSATVANDTSSGGNDGGGGMFSEGGIINVFLSSISSNTGNVTSNGGANGGGAILDEGIKSTYVTSTISANSMTIASSGALNGGGAIRTYGGVTISDATIAANHVNMPGGAIFSQGSVQFRNTIVADNSATPAGNCAGTGAYSSAGFNLESANTCAFTGTGDLVNTEPQLGPLQNNGGPTPTQALPVGSPAVDAGSCTDISGGPVTPDQRGVARPQPAGGKCDIGAFELAPTAPPPPHAKPAAVPSSPDTPSSTKATFSGTVNPEGQATTVFFQYGLDARDRPPGGPSGIVYDQSTPPQSLPADSTTHTVTASVSGLVPNAHYHVRLVATNATGTTVGQDQTFTTPADKPPPPPVLAKSVNAKPVSGKVFLLIGGKLVPLTEGDQLRSGTVVDTRHGSLQLTTATAKKGKRQTGTFSGAIFKITQVHSGLTTLSLMENAFSGAPSFASCSTKGAHAARVSKKTLQLLHASAKGKFRTKGRYAAATVRGTKWTIADRCDGTLTHDLTDSVVVNDFVRHKTIVLHAGQSYLALAQPPKKKKKK